MKRAFFLWNARMCSLFLLVCAVLAAQGPAQTAVSVVDPSEVPLKGPDGFLERYRIKVDLDQDGHDDLILSYYEGYFSQGLNGPWRVFLWRKDKFAEVGALAANPELISFERDRHYFDQALNRGFFARIWTYTRLNRSSGTLAYTSVRETGTEESSGLTIFTGDGGTKLGNKLLDALKPPDIPFVVQRSITDNTGKVSWIAY